MCEHEYDIHTYPAFNDKPAVLSAVVFRDLSKSVNLALSSTHFFFSFVYVWRARAIVLFCICGGRECVDFKGNERGVGVGVVVGVKNQWQI